MSIYKINQNLPLTRKFELLNNMIVELDGKLAQAQFDKNELDSLFDQSGFTGIRMYNRDVYLGNTLGTYSSWTHVKAETGYSIWKFPVTDYTYDITNQLYMDDSILSNRGSAGSESASTFNKVFTYDGVYTDVTSEAGSDDGTEFEIIANTFASGVSDYDYLYIGDDSVFIGAAFEFQTRGSGVDLYLEYWNGSAWSELTFTDNTNQMQSDGNLTWTAPIDWATSSVNSQTKYWVRISTLAQPSTAPKVYLCIPYNSVPALLSMSSTQIFAEEWAWCYYNGYIYVTIRNAGNTSYEGDYFITSASSTTNKQNYFIYNHVFKTDHKNTN